MRLLILVHVITICCSCFTDALSWREKLKAKAKSIYQKNMGVKDKTWHFTGSDLSEYPGANAHYRQMQAAKWEEYYTCLRLQNGSLMGRAAPIPEAIVAFESGSVKFVCKVCISPHEKEKASTIEWEWAGKGFKNLLPVDPNENILVSPDDKSLHMYNLGMDQIGQYRCKLGNLLTVPYYLTVISGRDTQLKLVHPKEAPNGPYETGQETVSGSNLILDSEWTEWSSCSSCGNVGFRSRNGFCTVYLNNTNAHNSKDVEILNIFKLGLPCDSHILPKSIQDLKQVKLRQNEVMRGYCKVPCEESKLFEVRDKDGNVLEVANNSAGVYSVLQGMPKTPPEPARQLLYGRKGGDVIVSCPGNLNSDAPIRWQEGNLNIVPELLAKESDGRKYISVLDRIHIKKAQIHDSNYYSCWQNKELAGVVQLVVEKVIVMNFNHHLMLLGMIVIMGTLIYIGTKAFVGRKYVQRAYYADVRKAQPLKLVDNK